MINEVFISILFIGIIEVLFMYFFRRVRILYGWSFYL